MSDQPYKPAVLLIHGFTSHRSSLEAIIPELDKRGLTWHYPILAGHGTKPEDLKYVRWEDWQEDMEQGLTYLEPAQQPIIIIALSMGALLALELAAKYPQQIAGLVLLSPCLEFYSSIAKYTRTVSRVIHRVPNPSIAKFSSLEQAKKDQGYLWFPSVAFRHYWLRTQHFDGVLEKVYQPVRIIHSHNDKVAAPSGAQHIYDTIPSQDKELIWLEKSGHEILLDIETDRVLEEIFRFSLLNKI